MVYAFCHSFFFFFFQAEDGIRDYKVTGVQTCALPISRHLTHRDHFPAAGRVLYSPVDGPRVRRKRRGGPADPVAELVVTRGVSDRDRKSTRLNSSHLVISYAVFCLKKKKHSFAQSVQQ